MFKVWFCIRTSQIDLEEIKRKGIKNLVIDIDRTFLESGNSQSPQDVIDWVSKAKELGFRVFFVSNTVYPEKVRRVYKKARVNEGNVLAKCNGIRRKPLGMIDAFIKFGISPKKTAVIGNNPFTDGIGAKLVRAKFYWVLKP